MKELSIEEKAKAYDERLDVARNIYADPSVKDEDKHYIEVIFPELCESEDERIRKEIINYFEHYPNIIVKRERKSDYIAWLEKLTQSRQEWSEEDEKMLKDTIRFCELCGNQVSANWLKSLKDRVQSQNLTVTDEELSQAKKDAYNEALDKIEYHSGEPTFDDGWNAAIWYLKKRNVQPQNTWKPSDEQMMQLGWIAKQNAHNILGKELMSLCQDLKNLRKK